MGCNLPVAAQSGGDVQPLALVVAVQLYLPGQCGARPHDAHIALQHVEQLWQLVQTGLAQKTSHPGNAGVALDLEHRAVHLVLAQQLIQLLLGVRAHGAKLIQPEQLAVPSYPPLPENSSVSGAVQHDGKADQQCHRRKQDQRQQGEYDVLCTPQHPVTPVAAQRLFPVDRNLRGGADC